MHAEREKMHAREDAILSGFLKHEKRKGKGAEVHAAPVVSLPPLGLMRLLLLPPLLRE